MSDDAANTNTTSDTRLQLTEFDRQQVVVPLSQFGRFVIRDPVRLDLLGCQIPGNVKPRTAQSLARHSDIWLTMGVYTHIALMDQAEAIETLPAPPRSTNGNGNGKANGDGASQSGAASTNLGVGTEKPNGGAEKDGGTNESGEEVDREKVPALVPSGAENGAVRLASPEYQSASVCTETSSKGDRKRPSARGRKLVNGREFCTDLHRPVALCSARKKRVRPAGFEPATLGSEDGQPIDVTTKPVAELRPTENREVPTVVPSPPRSVSDPHLPADLVEIIAAWNTLPEAVRASVLTIVRATKKQGQAGT